MELFKRKCNANFGGVFFRSDDFFNIAKQHRLKNKFLFLEKVGWLDDHQES